MSDISSETNERQSPVESGPARGLFDRTFLILVLATLLSLAMYLVHVDKVNGIPAHALFVHVPVVLLPLAGIAALLLAWNERWRARYLTVLTAVVIFSLALAVLSTGAGDALEKMIGGGGQAVEKHAEAGDKVPLLALGFTIVLLATRLLDRWRAGAQAGLALVASVVITLVAAANIGWVIYTGDLGARATWGDKTEHRS